MDVERLGLEAGKGHGLLERDGSRYAYRLTAKGVQVALLFLFFHKRLCGPLANSRFHHQPDPAHRPNSKLEAAYRLQEICDSLGPEQIEAVFRKWLKRIPLPLRPQDRAAGYDSRFRDSPPR